MYRNIKFCQTDLIALNVISLFSTFIIGKKLIDINEKYIMEMFVLSILLPIIIYINQKKYNYCT